MSKKAKIRKKKRALTIDELSREVMALKAALASVTASLVITQLVKASVKGPRRSEVFVDAQVVPMSGEFNRSGSRDIDLEPADVNVDVVLKGQVGTSTDFEITINGRTKSESFVTTQEKEIKSFTYPFTDFGLGGHLDA